ncbi:hypothetical protein TcBrA4_0113570 [Trypanosoma cruzi]|nr:hypothetical protein TcBrA4_0113570 [Trypanosoma cruzi]
MISCAAIQKLERYGQLGQKRRSVDDFVQSSLKDPKRGNVYALTHMPTWRSCLAALTPDDMLKMQPAVVDNDDEDDDDEKQLHNVGDGKEATVLAPAPVIVISDSLLYAISFATALVAHHLDEQRYVERKEKEEEKRTQRNKIRRGDDPAALVGKVFLSRLEEAEELLAVLQAVAEACGRHAHHRNEGSPVVTQALAHLLSTAADTVLIATILRQTDINNEEVEERRRIGLCRHATALVAAAATQLRTARARTPLNTLHDVRPCPTLLQQFLAKSKGTYSTVTRTMKSKDSGIVGMQSEIEKEDMDAIVILTLVAWAAVAPRGGLIARLAPFTLFQKLSLVDAIVAESPASCCCVEVSRYRRTLASLVSSTACNRATRLVVYFRGDDIKLMQNNVRDNAEYALHTHVTTPPAEEATLRSVAQLPEGQQQHAAFLLVQWMASIPFFYHSFCAEQSWTAFAQEQQRMVLLKESQARRERRNQRRHNKNFGNNPSFSPVSASSRGSSITTNDDNTSNTNNTNNNNNSDIDGIVQKNISRSDGNEGTFEEEYDVDDEDERKSLISNQSALSLASRASMISTMSRSSMTSYRAFLSVIEAARSDGNQMENALHFHQSEDGNTNLPLILLEEVTLALQRFMGTASDSSVAAMFNRFSLQTLAWRTIGELYTFIQSTITTAAPSSSLAFSNNMTASIRPITVAMDEIPAVFHFGQDIRYNRGLGYEVLGLLFAKVVLPQLLTTCGGPPVAQRRMEPAITYCLSAYEIIAPQVIDQNVSAILRIAARVAMDVSSQENKSEIHTSSTTLPPMSTTNTTTILHEFLISLVTRLGKSNQIPMLLDAIVSHVKKEGNTIQSADMYGDDVMVAGLHEIFSHPRVRAALVQACGISLDPEELLIHLLQYVSRWASEENEDEGAADAEANSGNEPSKVNTTSTTLSHLLPQEVLFILDIVATVVEGIIATSVTAVTLLERAAELELTLSTFLVNRLHRTFFSDKIEEEKEYGKSRNENKGNAVLKVPSSPFAGGEEIVRPKMQRRLVLYTLHAIYQARELIFGCLQDLGIQNVEAYLQMMEETMWQVQKNIGALVGPLSIDELDAAMSLSTQMRHAPYVHRAILLPQFVLQRLTLARSVSVALNVAVEPLTEARRITTFVLCHMRLASEGGYLPDGETTRALELADRITEEEWKCIVEFGRPKRVCHALVWLLRTTFAVSPTAWRSVAWLTRCLNSCAGFLLEALCEVIMGVNDDEVRARFYRYVKRNSNVEDDDGKEEEMLLQLCLALEDVLRRLGHIPQWPSLLQRAVHWLLLIQREREVLQDAKEEEEKMNKRKKKRMRTFLLESRVLQLVADFLLCEEGVPSLFRRILLRPEESHSLQRAGRKNGREKYTVINEAFVRAIRVPFVPSAAILHTDVGAPDNRNIRVDNDSDIEDEETEGETMAKRTASVCNILVRQIFSREFAILLVHYSERGEMAHCGATILRQVYTIALSACCGEKAATDSPSQAQNFLLAVVDEMYRLCCEEDNFSALSLFLKTMNNNPVAFASAIPKGTPAEVYRRKRQRHETRAEASLEATNDLATLAPDNNEDHEEEEHEGEVTKKNHNDHHDCGETRPLHEIAVRWMDLLGELFLRVLKSIKIETKEHLLHCFTALCISLKRVRGYAVMPQGSGRRPHQRQEKEGHFDRCFGTSLAFAAMASPRASGAIEDLRQLFAPNDEKMRRNSLVTLVRLLSSGKESALQALWVLFLIHDGRQRRVALGEENGITKDCGCWLAAVISNFDPRQDYSTSETTMCELLAATESWATGARRGNHSFSFVAMQRDAVYRTDAATRWVLDQLRVVPSILHAFPTDSAPVLLQEYMHTLLHEAISTSSFSFFYAAACPSSSTPTAFISQCLSRHEKLLWAACKALHQLSAVPHMRFSAWRGDVKRLLVVSGSRVLLNSAAKALWCRVLELCALPLPALHDDDMFIDHELNFIHTLLAKSSGTRYLEEEMLIRVLRLLTRTLLPLGVLWRRPHLLPALISALLTRILESVSRGHSGQILFNQLSSFFFQLVRDANHGSKDSNQSGGHVSPSVRMLCLASITSCLFRQSVAYIDVFTTHSSDLDFLAVDFLKALQRIHLPPRQTPSVPQQQCPVWSDATLCDLSYACVGHDDAQSLLRQAAERVEEEEGNGDRQIFMMPN